jgi:cytochrome P450
MGPERMLLVDDPAEVWQLLTTHARRTGKGRGLVRARRLLGHGLLTNEGDEHRRHRRVLQPAFTAAAVESYRTSFVRAAQRTANRWTDGTDIDLVADMAALTVDAAGSTLFGADLQATAPRITRALSVLLSGFRLAMLPGGPTLLRSPLPAAARVREAQAELEDIVSELVRRDPPPGSILELMAAEPGLTESDVRDEAMTLLLAGHETTAMALTWTLAAIDAEPAVRAGLEREWAAAAPAETSRGASTTLPRTLAVIAESMRLWPPSWMFSRRVLEPVTLGPRTVTGGTMCLISPALLHRDPESWSDPDCFRPDRWQRLGPNGEDQFDPRAPGQPRGAYLPFGAGPRMCIGEQFAWHEVATVLAELGRTWRVRISGASLTPGRSSMTLRPEGPVRASTIHRS